MTPVVHTDPASPHPATVATTAAEAGGHPTLLALDCTLAAAEDADAHSPGGEAGLTPPLRS